jgi:single-strand DNA-binding protein
MSKDLNQCNFIGRLGRDVETAALPSGGSVANIALACGDDYKDKNTGQKVEQTEWVRVKAFGRLADIMAQYLSKGSKVFITGKFTTRQWEKDGVKHYSTEIIANNMQMLDSRGNDQQLGALQPSQSKGQAPAAQQAPQQQQSQQQSQADDWDSEIPF